MSIEYFGTEIVFFFPEKSVFKKEFLKQDLYLEDTLEEVDGERGSEELGAQPFHGTRHDERCRGGD